jgi:hypothetical protein
MACGLPVIASDWNGYRDIIKSNRTGYRIPTYMPRFSQFLTDSEMIYQDHIFHLIQAQAVAINLPCLTNALVHLGNNPRQRWKMGAAARQHALSTYDRSAVSRQLRDLLQLPSIGRASIRPRLTKEPMSQWDVFSHYSSGALAYRTRLKLTPVGSRFLTRDPAIYLTPELKSFIDLGHARRIVDFCKRPRLIRQVLGSMAAENKDEATLYVVYWLLKQGFLEIASRSRLRKRTNASENG